jgi:hypothetical protein
MADRPAKHGMDPKNPEHAFTGHALTGRSASTAEGNGEPESASTALGDDIRHWPI